MTKTSRQNKPNKEGTRIRRDRSTGQVLIMPIRLWICYKRISNCIKLEKQLLSIDQAQSGSLFKAFAKILANSHGI